MGSKYKVIGIMSGTSLDGLDIAYCEFGQKKKWQYKIVHAETKKYSPQWKKRLSDAFKSGKDKIEQLDIEYGKFIGKETHKFIKRHKLSVDFIASHGHTIFHQPKKKITLQIGDGASIASACKLPVVCDFRSGDVALGGQGAPLVPLVDKLLFSQYTFCLNLGGFANISYTSPLRPSPAGDGNRQVGSAARGVRFAFDICPVNIILNDLAGKLGKEFDRGGKMASKGEIHEGLLKKLNSLPFYKTKPPKSLGREWVENFFMPVLDPFDISVQDKLRTVVEHIAIQIAQAVNSPYRIVHAGGQLHIVPDHSGDQLLITGGGAYNKFLVWTMQCYARCKIILPDDKTIQFKEAMTFAFLGILKMRGEINIMKSATGAKRNSSGGKIYIPDQNAESSS